MNEVQRFDTLKRAIEEDTTNFQARRELAVLCLDLGFEQMALKHLSYLANIFQEDASLQFNIGICWEKLKRYEYALKAYRRAVELKPDDPDFLYNLALVLEALGEEDEALLKFKEVACLEYSKSPSGDVGSANTFFCIGCLYSKKGDSKNAIKCFLRTIALDPSDYFAHFHLAQEYKKTGEVALAIDEYNKVLRLSSDYSWAYFNLGQIYWEQGDIENALSMLKKTIEKNPKDTECYKLIIKIFMSENNYAQAVKYAEVAIENFEEEGDFYLLLARAHMAAGDSEQYFEFLKKALGYIQSLSYDVKAIKMEYREAERARHGKQ
ncbi:TPR repeat-containing protein [Candidatus Gastranaerophilus sp. (ex Termes propinquus)]|nr:TPR repeat-containing protein [Candidatus Gastranaerophilus sp. (ex Termes propinquus)]